MSNPKFRWVRKATYSLKKRLGQPVLMRRTTNDATNFSTGQQVADLTTVFISKAVLMPAKVLRAFMRTITDTARLQNFAMGDMFDTRTRYLLIDQRDLPSDFPIDLNMHVIFPVSVSGIVTAKSKRWEVKGIEDVEEQESLILTLQAVDGALLTPESPNPNPPSPTPGFGNPRFSAPIHFLWNSQSPVLIMPVVNGSWLEHIKVVVIDGFDDVSATLSVGISTNHSLVMATDEVGTQPGEYISDQAIQFTAVDQLALYIVPGTSTRGSGYILATMRD